MGDAGEKANFLAQPIKDLERYQTVEAEILQEFPPTSDRLPLYHFFKDVLEIKNVKSKTIL
jgi:hypothetical protein